MNAEEYRAHRIAEIDGELRLHRAYGVRCALPSDLTSAEYTAIARRAVEREASILRAMGVRRLAPSEGPRLVG